MEYLTVGTNEIKRELFNPVKDKPNMSFKPCGGLWLTEQDQRYSGYNAWVDYLINNPTAFYYKSMKYDMWNQPCSLVTLKDDCHLFMLGNAQDYYHLMDNYAIDDKRFSHEQLAKSYDGIFVNLRNLDGSINNGVGLKIALEYCVDTLLLFNLDCIKYYQPGTVAIEPFDIEYYMYESGAYEIKIDKVKKRIK